MNENLVCWVFFVVMFFWHMIMNCLCTRKCVYACFGKGSWMVQTYTLVMLGLGLLQCRSAFDVLVFDVQRYNWLTSPQVAEDVRSIPGVTAEEIASYHIHDWMRKLSLASPLLGTAAFFLVAIQVILIGASRRTATDKAAPWDNRLTVRDTCVMLVIGMPAVFIVMCNRATIRVLAIISGSAWAGYAKDHPGHRTQMEWQLLKRKEWGLYEMDLELASAFQFITVFGFGYLCAKCLDRPSVNPNYRFALKWAGIQGVYAFVLVGLIRSLGNFSVSVAQSFAQDYVSDDQITIFQTQVLSKVSAVFTFTTILCVYNMFIISRMPEIQETIPNCTTKFLATRVLLLVAQLQPEVFKQMDTHSPLMVRLKSLAMFQDNAMIQEWRFSKEQGWLLHSSLLSGYCLAIVLWNLVAWGKLKYTSDDDLHTRGDDYTELPASAPIVAVG